MAGRTPQPGALHPDRWRDDLNPNADAGQNRGGDSDRSADAPTAYDVKELHRRLSEYGDDELKRIPVVPAGARLEQGATYIDLTAEQPAEFTATGDMEAGRQHCYVSKRDVEYQL
jgi:hypothetical protein